MYKATFKNFSDIRMGSPYNSADLELSGGFVPDLEHATFQDLFAINSDGSECYLVEWAFDANNSPGFRVWKISDRERRVEKSARIPGCCISLQLQKDHVVAEVYQHPHKVTVLVSGFEINRPAEYEVRFKFMGDIGLGALHKGGQVELSGSFVPNLEGHFFQNLFALSPDRFDCYLVQWAFEKEEPGFVVWKISARNQLVSKSERIAGCCEAIHLRDGQIVGEILLNTGKRPYRVNWL